MCVIFSGGGVGGVVWVGVLNWGKSREEDGFDLQDALCPAGFGGAEVCSHACQLARRRLSTSTPNAVLRALLDGGDV